MVASDFSLRRLDLLQISASRFFPGGEFWPSYSEELELSRPDSRRHFLVTVREFAGNDRKFNMRLFLPCCPA